MNTSLLLLVLAHAIDYEYIMAEQIRVVTYQLVLNHLLMNDLDKLKNWFRVAIFIYLSGRLIKLIFNRFVFKNRIEFRVMVAVMEGCHSMLSNWILSKLSASLAKMRCCFVVIQLFTRLCRLVYRERNSFSNVPECYRSPGIMSLTMWFNETKIFPMQFRLFMKTNWNNFE